MCLYLKILFYVYLFEGVLSAFQMSWLPCKFTDEHVSLKEDTLKLRQQKFVHTKYIPRKAVLQFGQKGDAPVDPDTVTFLITPSKLELRRFVEGVDMEQVTCELQRYSTEGIHVRWPVKGEHEYNRWFTCTLKHSKGLFTVLSFIRQSTAQSPTGQHDYRNWTAIEDGEVLTTSVVMVMQTQSPSVKASLGSQQKLHCQFAMDHKAAKVAVEWHRHGESGTELFSYSSQSGNTQGSGVALTKLAEGDATYTIPRIKMGTEDTYICSVAVYPLFGKLEISLQIESSPEVSINVGPTLTLLEGDEKRVICEADGYYPLDVNIHWSHHSGVDAGHRAVMNAGFSSHKQNADRTISLLSFFTLRAKLSDSGSEFICTVSHQSLREPIKKSFTLIVQEPGQWILVFNVVLLLVVGFVFLRYMCRVRRSRFY